MQPAAPVIVCRVAGVSAAKSAHADKSNCPCGEVNTSGAANSNKGVWRSMRNSAGSRFCSSQFHSASLNPLVSLRANQAKSRRVPLRCSSCQRCSDAISSYRDSARLTGSSSSASKTGVSSCAVQRWCKSARKVCQRCASCSLSLIPSAARRMGGLRNSTDCGHQSPCLRSSMTIAQPWRNSHSRRLSASARLAVPASFNSVSQRLLPPRLTQRASSSRHSAGINLSSVAGPMRNRRRRLHSARSSSASI